MKVLKLIVLGVVVLGIKILSPQLATVGNPELKTQGIIKTQAVVSSTDEPGIVQVKFGDTILEVENPLNSVYEGLAEITVEKSQNRAILKRVVPVELDATACRMGTSSKTVYLQNNDKPYYIGTTPSGKECTAEF